MKKHLILLFLFIIYTFSGCQSIQTDNSYTLTSNQWKADLKGGATVELNFNEENASLSIKNGNNKTKIKGKYIADEDSFIILDYSLKKNYCFSYILHKDSLDITYNGGTICMNVSRETN